MPAPMPTSWSDLIEGITMLAQHPTDTTSPFYCSPDTLHVLADETAFTSAEIDRLDALGFSVDSSDGGFYSHRFGSA